MTDWKESPEAIAAVDAILAGVGLEHGRRRTRTGTWSSGERLKTPKTSPERAVTGSSRRAPGVVFPWPQERYPWLRAGFSTRIGGESTVYGPGELNLGWTSADAPETVAANRQRFVKAVADGKTFDLVAIRQFHSNMIRDLDKLSRPWTTPEGKADLRGDGLMTSRENLLLGIQTADCVPVLLADTRKRAVAAFHAGWRGTLARIVERGVGSMQLLYGSHPKDLIAAIGPCIGGCCYAVGEDIRFEFESRFAYGRELFSEIYDSDPVRDKYPLLFLTARAPGHSNIGPQIHLDLVEANRRQLLDAGVHADRITVSGECTACTRLKNGRRKYFSHRDEHGFTGRMLSVIGVAE